MTRACRRMLALAAVIAGGALSAPAPSGARNLVLSATGEAAVAQPMVVLGLGDRPVEERRHDPPPRSKNELADLDLEALAADVPVVAILDTGASGHVLSQGTAERFGIAA